MAAGERVLGSWRVTYLPPCDAEYTGQLWVTDRRVVFAAEVSADLLGRVVAGPVDAAAVACALDLDATHVAYEQGCLAISIPKSQIEIKVGAALRRGAPDSHVAPLL